MTPRTRKQTCRLALLALAGLAAGVMAQSGGYPAVADPPENPSNPDKVVLGKMLFWDEQLSSTDTVACGTCHIPTSGGTDPRAVDPESLNPGPDMLPNTLDDVAGSQGVRRARRFGRLVDDGTFFPGLQVTGRKAPSMIDAMHFDSLFWDGRAAGSFADPQTGMPAIAAGGALESQSVAPPVSDVEMAHESRTWNDVAAKIRKVTPMKLATSLPPDMVQALAGDPSYPDLFQAAFGDPAVTGRRIAFAIAAYERTLISDQTPWDSFDAGDPTALTPSQQSGLALFEGAARCNLCHPAPLFTDGLFHNVGFTDPNLDVGRMAVTGLPGDKGRMKTPSLRNVGLREPTGLFHDGLVAGQGGSPLTIAVGILYQNGGASSQFPENLDPDMQDLGLTGQEVADIVDFLQNGLTDPRVAAGLPPFDRPTLRSELQANPATANPTVIGAGFGHNVGAGPFPQILIDEPPALGHPYYTIGVANSLGGTTAFLAVGAENTSEPPLFGIVPYYVASMPQPAVVQIVLDGAPVYGEGYGSVTIGLPNLPALAGFTFFAQWFMFDPPVSFLATSDGVRVQLF